MNSLGYYQDDVNDIQYLTRICEWVRGQSFLSPDTRLECFLRGAKFLAKNPDLKKTGP